MKIILVGSAVAALVLAVPAPASAATGDDPDPAVGILAEFLDITVPATADLGSGSSDEPLVGPLGPVTVDDTRDALDASWAAEVTATSFTTGDSTGPETVPATSVAYWSGPATSTVGNGTFTPGQVLAEDAVPIAAPMTAFALTGGDGDNSAMWNPTILLFVDPANVAGVYTGTVTHSVA